MFSKTSPSTVTMPCCTLASLCPLLHGSSGVSLIVTCAIDVAVVVRIIDAVAALVDVQVLQQHAGRLRAESRSASPRSSCCGR